MYVYGENGHVFSKEINSIEMCSSITSSIIIISSACSLKITTITYVAVTLITDVQPLFIRHRFDRRLSIPTNRTTDKNQTKKRKKRYWVDIKLKSGDQKLRRVTH